MRTTRHPKTLALGLIAAGALLLGACSGPAGNADAPAKATGAVPTASSDSLVAAAKKEGKVVWYSSNIRPNVDAITKAFQSKYPGIKVEAFQAGGSQVASKVEAEILSGKIKADFVDYSEGSVAIDQAKRGLLERFAPEHIGEVAKDLRDPDGHFFSPYFLTSSIAYNTDIVSEAEAPKSWKDLTDPKWQGKVAMGSPDYAGTAVGTIAAWDQKFGPDYIKELGTNKMQVLKSFGDVQNSLLSGQAPLGVIVSFRGIASEAAGEPIKLIVPKEGQVKLASAGAVVAKADHPNAAKLLANFLMSDEVQKIAAGSGMFPARVEFGASIKGYEDMSSHTFIQADGETLADPSYVAKVKKLFADVM